MNFEIKNHLLFLDGKQVAYKPTPNIGSGENKLQYLIEHYTATYDSVSPISWLTDKASAVSAHLVIGKDGTVTQLAPFNKITWHAGKSEWNGLVGMNSYAIGIEIVNSGILGKKNDKFVSADGHVVTSYSEMTNKLGVRATWELYPDKQIEVVAAVSQALQSHYLLKEIIGHEDVSPHRKTDPGPAFPWDKIRPKTPPTPIYPSKTANANLNVREGVDINSKLLRVIPKGTKLKILKEDRDRSFIGDGWVSSKYLV